MTEIQRNQNPFFTNDRICFNCHKRGHIAKYCCAQQSEPNIDKRNSKITYFESKKVGHIAKNCFIKKN